MNRLCAERQEQLWKSGRKLVLRMRKMFKNVSKEGRLYEAISNNKSAFVKGRNIIDNTLIVQKTANPNGERVDIIRGSDILKRRLLGHFCEARGVFSEIQSDRSEENVENVWSVSLHVEKDIDRWRRPTIEATVLNI
ncbi:hypothetical protein GQ457_09G023970 [Hibiscus cannabinus]